MKKNDLSKLALLGISSGLLAACGSGGESSDAEVANPFESQGEKIALIGEEEFLAQLGDNSRALYESLDDESKQLVLKVASASCAGENPCAGLNGCKTKDHACAGMSECAGKGGCAASPDTAVKLVVKRLAEERAKIDY